MAKRKHLAAMALCVVVAIPLVMLSGCNVGQYQEPAYTASDTQGDIELRDYMPAIAAQVSVEGPRQQAISDGFRLIADYIFGNNAPKATIAMTTPVIQQADTKGEKIAMTTPVIQQGEDDRWTVQFIMPAEYTLETLPKPNNPAVKLVPVAARQMAVIRFSGSSKNDEKIVEKTAELEAFVKAKGLRTIGQPVLAFYDPPWTLPFLRRNEVMLAIKPAETKGTKH